MRRAYLAQVQNRYGGNAYLPYSAGLMWAYAASHDDVREEWELGGFLYQKESIDRALSRIEDPDLLALSCYVWNFRWQLELARAVKEKWPKCVVLAGGVHVEENSTSIVQGSAIDMGIYGEGEGAFLEVLRNFDPSTIDSLIYKCSDHPGGYRNRRHGQVPVDELRSPYLDGVFDDILKEQPRWQFLQETNRGCPYACTFCAWGAASQDKVRQLPMEQVLAELDWASAHQCDYVECCDANFGILKRDEEIVEHMIRLKRETGYPRSFRAAWAKNTTERVFQMAEKLHAADMMKSVTLSVQSMDDGVLRIAKRKNVKFDRLGDFVKKYEAAGIPTYTEVILGLPGETVDTFKDGICQLLDAGQHDGLFVYPCLVLPNTELADPKYRVRHGIETKTVKAMLLHGVPDPSVIEEEQEIVIGTSAMPHAQWRDAYDFAWVVQALHSCGLTQHVARVLHSEGLGYRPFYEDLLDQLVLGPFEKEWVRMSTLVSAALDGESWHLVDPRFGDVSWPPEEFAFLQFACESEKFYDALKSCYPAWGELIEEQHQIFVPPELGKEEQYAREAVWYGRKGSGSKLRTRAA